MIQVCDGAGSDGPGVLPWRTHLALWEHFAAPCGDTGTPTNGTGSSLLLASKHLWCPSRLQCRAQCLLPTLSAWPQATVYLCSLPLSALSHPRCTCIWTASVPGATVQQPFPQHGEGLHVHPLVFCEVLARGEYREEVRSHCSIHLGDGTWLWEEGQGWGQVVGLINYSGEQKSCEAVSSSMAQKPAVPTLSQDCT